MLAVDRRHRILQRVAAEQTIHISALARELAVSEMTIRRDINRLERDGFLRRTYGGATAHITRSLELAFNARALEHAAAKRLIGIKAAALVGDSQTMFIGIGTTAEQFALFLPNRADLTVITDSLPIASLVATRQPSVLVLGGAIRKDELSCVGSAAAAAVARYHVDVAVLGAAGISAEDGITELFDEEAEIHRLMIERSKSLIVLADSSKFGRTCLAAVAPASAIDVLVTDQAAPGEEVDRLQRLGVQVVRADA